MSPVAQDGDGEGGGCAEGRAERMPVAPKHVVLGTPMVPPFPVGLETAVFGLGCFWGAERKFWQVKGVYSTAVGYAGGFTPNPTYEEVCSGLTGHTEAVLVVFDPKIVPFDRLLKVFWESHDPTQGMRQGGDTGTQYRSAIYGRSDSQLRPREPAATSYQARLGSGRLRADHDRDRPGRRILLRRGLPPAVPREEPGRLLRHRGDGSGVPRRRSNLTIVRSKKPEGPTDDCQKQEEDKLHRTIVRSK